MFCMNIDTWLLQNVYSELKDVTNNRKTLSN